MVYNGQTFGKRWLQFVNHNEVIAAGRRKRKRRSRAQEEAA